MKLYVCSINHSKDISFKTFGGLNQPSTPRLGRVNKENAKV